MYLVIILFALFASLFTLQKETLNFCEPFFLVGFRMTFAGLLLIIYSKYTCKNKLSWIHWKSLLLLSFFQIYLANMCEIWALKYMQSSKVCLIFSLSPFISALIAFIIIKETMSHKKWLGMLIGFIGLIPIIFTCKQQESASGSFFIFSYAELVLLIGVISSVYGWILLKKVLQDLNCSIVVANGISMLLGGILSLIHSWLSGENWNPIPINNFHLFLFYSTIMCLISNVICYNLYGFLLKTYSATFMSFAGLITPLFAALFGFVFLQETITWHFWISIILFTCGLIIFHKQEIKYKFNDTN